MSRTDHPRIKGTHRAGRIEKCTAWCCVGLPAGTQRRMVQADIAEGVLAWLHSTAPAKTEAVTRFEIEVAHAEAIEIDREFEYDAYMDEQAARAAMAEDAWTYEYGSSEPPTMMYDDEPAEAYFGDWLPVVSVEQACEELHGFTIEGPAVRPGPRKSENYRHVFEVARLLGVPSKTLITRLRLEGEYVANHMSMVALPVVDRLVR